MYALAGERDDHKPDEIKPNLSDRRLHHRRQHYLRIAFTIRVGGAEILASYDLNPEQDRWQLAFELCDLGPRAARPAILDSLGYLPNGLEHFTNTHLVVVSNGFGGGSWRHDLNRAVFKCLSVRVVSCRNAGSNDIYVNQI